MGRMCAFPIPDYAGGSLVNLMASCAARLGVAPAANAIYPQAERLSAAELGRARRIVLLLVDGLGYDYVQRQAQDSALRRHLAGHLDSVFPTTTAAAITSLLTAVAPQQHAITGWFLWLRELRRVTTILPFLSRGEQLDLHRAGYDIRSVLGASPWLAQAAAGCYVLAPEWIVDSAYSQATGGSASRQGYQGLTDFFTKLTALVARADSRFIYAYWPDYDALAHERGVGSPELAQHYRQLDKAFAEFLSRIAGSETYVVATADHGFIDTGPEHYLHLADYPDLSDCLARPLCGEPRAAYCYIKPGRGAAFERWIERHWQAYCECHRSQALIEAGYFGLGTPHPELAARVGDYTLVFKDRYVIKDYVTGERPFFFHGVHSGLSEAELRVPLILAQA